jgi:hypothetical protein
VDIPRSREDILADAGRLGSGLSVSLLTRGWVEIKGPVR